MTEEEIYLKKVKSMILDPISEYVSLISAPTSDELKDQRIIDPNPDELYEFLKSIWDDKDKRYTRSLDFKKSDYCLLSTLSFKVFIKHGKLTGYFNGWENGT